MWKLPLLVAVALIPWHVALAQVMRGKVTLPDGSPPRQRVIVERVCQGSTPVQDAITGKQGEYFWRVPPWDTTRVGPGSRIRESVRCVLRARLKDMQSDGIDIQDPRILRNLQLPN